LDLKSKYKALQKSSENTLKETSTRLEESMAENNNLSNELERISALFGGVDPEQIMADFDLSKTELASTLAKIEGLEGELSATNAALASLQGKISEMTSLHSVMNWEAKLLETDRRLLSAKLGQTEASLSREHKKRKNLEEEVKRLHAKTDIMAEDRKKVANQKKNLSDQLTKMIRERDELNKQVALLKGVSERATTESK
jgi:chromosome segregation ATPase